MVGDRRAITVVSIRLLPNAAIFQSDHRGAFDAFDVSVNAAHQGIKLRPGADGGSAISFLGCLFRLLVSFFDLLVRFYLCLLAGLLLRGLTITLEISVQVLQLIFV